MCGARREPGNIIAVFPSMSGANPHLLWYDRVQCALERCMNEALRLGDGAKARRTLLLRLWANDRAELLAEQRYGSPVGKRT